MIKNTHRLGKAIGNKLKSKKKYLHKNVLHINNNFWPQKTLFVLIMKTLE